MCYQLYAELSETEFEDHRAENERLRLVLNAVGKINMSTCNHLNMKRTGSVIYTAPCRYVTQCPDCGLTTYEEEGTGAIEVLTVKEAYERRPQMYKDVPPEQLEKYGIYTRRSNGYTFAAFHRDEAKGGALVLVYMDDGHDPSTFVVHEDDIEVIGKAFCNW